MQIKQAFMETHLEAANHNPSECKARAVHSVTIKTMSHVVKTCRRTTYQELGFVT